jgi:hydroxyethylthiazole kinase
MISAETVWKDVQTIRERSPLVHNITNFVVMNNTANALLALGASPVMAHAEEEAADMVSISGALVINIGTLSKHWIQAMEKAMQKAKELGKPIIIDPVGAGATAYRTETARRMIREFSPSIIRGNGSEIMALWADNVSTKGVDSSDSSDSALEMAKVLALSTHSAVCISGETDYIVSKNASYSIANGHAMMPAVTGLGCTATALCGAFSAVNADPAIAAAHAMAVMGIAGEIAVEKSAGPGSMQMNFIDALYNLSEKDIKDRFRKGAI